MKIRKAKKKVARKTSSTKSKVRRKVAKCAMLAFALACFAGCLAPEAPTAQRAQHVMAKDISIVFNVNCQDGLTSTNVPTFSVEVATAAQANETSGTESMTTTPTQTPTMTVTTDIQLTYGLTSNSAAGTDWISQLTSASAKGLAAWLKGGKATGQMTVTKRDGTTETVTCEDGQCTTQDGYCITCQDCTI